MAAVLAATLPRNKGATFAEISKLEHHTKKNNHDGELSFNITDIKINNLFKLQLNDIRYIVLNYEVPIKLEGTKTIDVVHIYVPKLVNAVKDYIKSRYSWRDNDGYELLIDYLYDNFLQSERDEIIKKQKADFLNHFSIQKGDILQLNDDRIVVANRIEINLTGEITIEYLNLKVNLDVGDRKRKVPATNVAFVLNQKDFAAYKGYTPSRRISLLNKWMLKRKTKVAVASFKPDLITSI